MHSSRYRFAGAAILIGLVLTGPLFAQSAFYVEYNNRMCPVRAVHEYRPCIEDNGRLVETKGNSAMLHPVSEYYPITIKAGKLLASYDPMFIDGKGRVFELEATFETAWHCRDVFVVLEMQTNLGPKLFCYEVGNLEPFIPHPFECQVPIDSGYNEGQYVLHMFVQGAEVFNSQQPKEYWDHELDKIVSKRVQGLQQSEPKPYFGPPPEYPAALKKTNANGQVIVTIRIGRNGAVMNPAIKSTTDPVFNEPVLAAVRLWRFLPRIENGSPVEATVDVPFVISPPVVPAVKK